MKLGSDKRIKWWGIEGWRGTSSHLSALWFCRKYIEVSEWGVNECCLLPVTLSIWSFLHQHRQHGREYETMRITQGQRGGSLHMEYISNNYGNADVAVSSDRVYCGISFKTRPHYATLMQENTWSIAFTWLCVTGIKGLWRLGIIARLFQAGGTVCLGCSQVSGRLWFGTPRPQAH